jgi:diacylglycerol kinase family enzyme
MRADLIYNAHAGRCVVRREIESVVEYLEDNGWTVSVRETPAPRDATELARRAAARGRPANPRMHLMHQSLGGKFR